MSKPFWTRVTVLQSVVVFVVVFGGLMLTSWDMWKTPSKHFHFVDLAESFLAGRLDTDTPRRKKGGVSLPEDPPGLQEAVERQMSGGGWNDWVSYDEITLNSGETYKGVWPWKTRRAGQPGHDRRNRFVTLSGDWLEVDPGADLRRVCVEVPRFGSGQEEERVRWEVTGQIEELARHCAGEDGPGFGQCPMGQRRMACQVKRNFISFPPFPAVAMLPWVTLWHYHLNDVLFTLVFAALNAVLLLLLLRRLRDSGYVSRPDGQLWVLVFLFAFGTVSFFSSIRGEVWFTALVLGVTMHLLYLYFAFDLRSPFLAGVFAAFGFATRTPLLFATSFFFLQVMLQRVPWDKSGWVKRLRQVAAFAVPCLAVGVGLMLYNHARFGNPLEFGHRFLAEGTRQSIVDHGMFSAWFLPRNLAALFTNVPQFLAEPPYVQITGHGLALFAVTPAFFFLLWPRARGVAEVSAPRYRWSMMTILWASVAFTALPGVFYQNTGWFQFAYRFAMDYLPMLMVLLAMDRRRWGALFYVLVLMSIAFNLFGAITFNRFGQFYY